MIVFNIKNSSLEVLSGTTVILLFPLKNIGINSNSLYSSVPEISLYNLNVGVNELVIKQPLFNVSNINGAVFTVDSFIDFASENFGIDSVVNVDNNTQIGLNGSRAFSLINSATNQIGVIKASKGVVYNLSFVNSSTSDILYVGFYDKSTIPDVLTDTPILTISVPTNELGAGIVESFIYGLIFENGISYAISLVPNLSDATLVTPNKLIANVIYDNTASLPTPQFITTWRTSTANETITIPTNGGGYNYDITTSDGQTFTGVTGNQEITFAVAGDYDVRISGDFPTIYFNNVNDKSKIIGIKQWGSIVWGSFESSFFGCSNLVGSFTDAPNLSSVTNMTEMFRDASSLNSPLNAWDLSGVTDTSYMFYGCTIFNQPIGYWNVSSVTTMSHMFFKAESFNSDLSAWNVGNVTDMSSMFFNNFIFNSPLNAWNVSSVTNMSKMFRDAYLFNQPLNAWNVSSVTDMSEMFRFAIVFDQPLNSWNVSSVTNMQQMFFNASKFNSNVNNWDVSSVDTMGLMFGSALLFNQDISAWNVSNATNLFNMFSNVTFQTSNYDAILVGWEAILQSFFPNGSGYTPTISILFGNSQYTGGGSAETARASLVSNFNWTITDGGIA